nr:hypothetical protein [bacterium]
MKGGKVESAIGMKIMLYTYCTTFSINPSEAYETPASLIKEMLEIHGEVKRLESEAIHKAKSST